MIVNNQMLCNYVYGKIEAQDIRSGDINAYLSHQARLPTWPHAITKHAGILYTWIYTNVLLLLNNIENKPALSEENNLTYKILNYNWSVANTLVVFKDNSRQSKILNNHLNPIYKILQIKLQ